MPKGFIEELKKYDDYDNRTIKIVLKKSYDEQTRVKYDISTGDCWYIDSSQDLEDQISYCVIQSVIFNMVNRKDRDGLLLKWNDFNPEDYKYGDDDKYAEYFYGNTSKENAYFIDPKPLQSAGDDATTIFILLMKSDYDWMIYSKTALKYVIKQNTFVKKWREHLKPWMRPHIGTGILQVKNNTRGIK